MRIERIAWYPYRIPFRATFTTARGGMAVREGALLALYADDGLVGWGDIAPLPTFGATIDDSLPSLEIIGPRLRSLDGSELLDVFDHATADRVRSHAMAALRCGLDLAVCDLLAQERNQPLAEWLDGTASNPAAVPVNATLGAADIEVVQAEALGGVSAGFTVFKLKVGSHDDLHAEWERVAAVRAAIGPDAELRLDANGAWSRERALAFLAGLDTYNIALIEQPVATIADLAYVRSMAPEIPLAADELVTSLPAAEAIIAAGAADVLVVKPVVVGGIRAAHAIVQLAQRAGLGVIVTSMLESGIGVAGSLHLAATLTPPVRACGLATTQLLASDLLEQKLPLHAGRLDLPRGPGLGVRPAMEVVRRWKRAEGG